MSFKYGDGEREVDGRRFTDMDEDDLNTLVSSLTAMEVGEVWLTQDKRPDRKEIWVNGILRKKDCN